MTAMNNALELAFWRKPLDPHASLASHSVQEQETAGEMERTLGLFDLIMIGIGGTVGTGVFATAGLIASTYAGPAATLSWLIAGLGCLLSGLSFMELACLIPSAGSTYAYAYHALGELPALIAGFLLTLEYGVACAGGARSWSDKLTEWMASHVGIHGPAWMKPPDSVIDVYAGLLIASCTGIILCGMHVGKYVVNVVTMTKISVVLLIIVVGLVHFDSSKIRPFIPAQTTLVDDQGHETLAFGWPGVFVGASASFYGYIGYDEVCCLAGEAKTPSKTIPRAVVGTILGAALLSILATLSLVGMQQYTQIDAKESFGQAFSSLGVDWAAFVVASGEVLTMPITSFIGFLAQPRVQYAMAKDGLLPAVFATMDARGCLFQGTLLCGLAATLLAVFVPFHVLWNFISLGILVAFNLTNTSLLVLRAGHKTNEEEATKRGHGGLITGYLVFSFLAAFHWQKGVLVNGPLNASTRRASFHRYMHHLGPIAAIFFTLIAMGFMVALYKADTKETMVGETKKTQQKEEKEEEEESVDIVLASKKEKDMMMIMAETDRGTCHHRRRSFDRDEETDQGKRLNDKGEAARPLSMAGTVNSSDNEDVQGDEEKDEEKEDPVPSFRAPFVPFAPCVAIFFNWFLFAQMDGTSVLLILLWLMLAVAVYFGYSRHHSLAFQQTQYHQLAQN